MSAATILCFLLILASTSAYKPVVLFHGILSDAASMLIIGEEIKLVSFFSFFKCIL